jgi:hypothetical protein
MGNSNGFINKGGTVFEQVAAQGFERAILRPQGLDIVASRCS